MKRVAAVVIGWALGAHQPAAADPSCPPAARLVGDPEVGHQVALELAILGVQSADIPAGCPAVEVVVGRTDRGVLVAVRDPAGREEAQTVTDAQVAATWIESWVHPDIAAPLLTAGAGFAAIPTGDPVAVRTLAPRSPDRFGYRGVIVAAAGELHSADDDSDWRALSASACARFGALCPGLAARAGDNRGLSIDGGATSSNRFAVELLATLSAPMEVGRMTLAPSLGLGLGYTRTGRGGGTTCSVENGPDPATGAMCEPPVAIDDGFTAWNLGPRGEVGLSGSFPIAGGLSLVLGVSMSFVPMARDQAVMPDYAEQYFTSTDPDDPNSEPPSPDGMSEPGADGWIPPPELGVESYQLPAEPTRFTRIGLGLSWELP
jgi:hypothetical protein